MARSSALTYEQFGIICGQIEAKHRCVIENGVIVISRKEIKDLSRILSA
jgi:hypothetical protein